jgi:hypothetical protein
MHFAEINEKNEVLRVIVCDTKEWCESNLGGTWVRTYYSTPGKNYAGVGSTYYPNVENFAGQRPYTSWKLNDSLQWQAPIPYPTDTDTIYVWSEPTLTWEKSN